MKNLRRTHLRRLLLAVLLVLAAAPPANAGHQDYGTDLALRLTQQAPSADLRSPDTRDAALATKLSQGGQAVTPLVDLRSPDSRDAARGYRTPLTIEIVRVVGPSEFGWRDAGIGALGAFAVALLAAGSVLAALRRRRSRFAAL